METQIRTSDKASGIITASNQKMFNIQKTKSKMKKYHITLWLIALTLNYAYAQYSDRNYLHPNSFLTSAKTTNNIPGFVMAGAFPATIANDFVIQQTDVNGLLTGIGAQYYNIVPLPACTPMPPTVGSCTGVDVIETNPASGAAYAVAGIYAGGIFFTILDATNGLPSVAKYWSPIATSAMWGHTIIRESATSGQYYICCNGGGGFVVIKIDITLPTLVAWQRLYRNPTLAIEAKSMIESPYNAADELIVVGLCQPNGWLAHEGMFVSIDISTGNFNYLNCYSDTTYSGDEYFASIELAASTAGGSDGFIIGGSHYNGDPSKAGHHAWMIKLDPTGNMVWSSLMSHHNPVIDVFERYNPIASPPHYEYFGIIHTPTHLGNNELTVVKLDDLGGGSILLPNVFKYTIGTYNASVADYTYPQLDFVGDGTVAGDGFAAFATDVSIPPTSNQKYALIKAYYNGVNGCETTDDMSVVNGPGFSTTAQLNEYLIPDPCDINISLPTNGSSVSSPCGWSSTIPGGSNARPAAITDVKSHTKADNLVSVYPNPSNGVVAIEIAGAAQAAPIQIKLTNAMGQLIETFNFNAAQSGHEKIMLDFAELGVSEGLYFMHISVQNQTQTKKLMYSK